jgi:Na+/H+ antiporter NhaD/arsenite permease-like protein
MEHAVALAVFASSYAALGLGRVPGFRVDRTGVAIIGAVAMVVGGGLGWDDAVRSEYSRVGAPLTILTLLVGWLVLSLVRV